MMDLHSQGASLLIWLAICGLVSIALSGCATRYQPPGGGLYVAVKHVEAQRKP